MNVVGEWMNKRMNEWMNEWMSEWVKRMSEWDISVHRSRTLAWMPQHFHPSQYQPHSPHPIRCHRYNSDESLPCTLPAKRPANTTTHQTHCDVKEYNNSGIVFDKNIKHMTLHSTLYRSSTLLYLNYSTLSTTPLSINLLQQWRISQPHRPWLLLLSPHSYTHTLTWSFGCLAKDSLQISIHSSSFPLRSLLIAFQMGSIPPPPLASWRIAITHTPDTAQHSTCDVLN